ncbi:DUF6193 family natural product biosynthesis protein [Actinomadura sp. LOL_016]|uniref:DUF6193 family natural product biosynthesis protein n=1 Tax=unclassified Actinomadura TaxID=2626254 RepID=UPI003A813D0D
MSTFFVASSVAIRCVIACDKVKAPQVLATPVTQGRTAGGERRPPSATSRACRHAVRYTPPCHDRQCRPASPRVARRSVVSRTRLGRRGKWQCVLKDARRADWPQYHASIDAAHSEPMPRRLSPFTSHWAPNFPAVPTTPSGNGGTGRS